MGDDHRTEEQRSELIELHEYVNDLSRKDIPLFFSSGKRYTHWRLNSDVA
jgi:hypothetical protein